MLSNMAKSMNNPMLTKYDEGIQDGAYKMANRYGEAALMAARQGNTTDVDPVARWQSAMERLYPTSPIARKKGSPRGAFLGLCEQGLVKGIPAGSYSATKFNKDYAVRAAELLLAGMPNPSRSSLWRAVVNNASIEENGQMDVVLALWKNNLIVPVV
jgi:hypothetical protein